MLHHLNPIHLARKKKKEFDYLAYVIIGVNFLMGLPQLYHVYESQSAQDIVLVSWLGSLAISVFWLLYGLERGVKPIIISSFAHLAMGILMINGIIQFNGTFW